MGNHFKEKTKVLGITNETDIALEFRVRLLNRQGLCPCEADVRGGGQAPSVQEEAFNTYNWAKLR